jgi:hypothetical protein
MERVPGPKWNKKPGKGPMQHGYPLGRVAVLFASYTKNGIKSYILIARFWEANF